MNVATTRQEAESRILVLRQRRGAAMLDGDGCGEIDAELQQATAALAALEDSEAEAVRRQREAANREWADARAKNITEALSADKKRLAAVGRAQQALWDFVGAVNEIGEASAAEQAALQRLAMPRLELGAHHTRKRLSALAAPVFDTIAGSNRKRLGDLQWHSVGRPPVDWCEAERAAVDLSDIKPQEAKPNGKHR